jgi:hypothetical protein
MVPINPRNEDQRMTTATLPTDDVSRLKPLRSFELNLESFREKFPHEPFTVKHNLVGHPLFSIERLMELAKRLPESDVEYNAGNIPVDMGDQLSPRTGLSAEETIRRIQECRSWMVLKYVENDPEYRCLLDQCLDEIKELSEAVLPGMHQREGFIFLTSPNSITPYHLDPEHNFLLQVRGRKQVNIFDPRRTEVITEAEIERGLFGKIRNLAYRDEFQTKGQLFELDPGMGLHFPLIAPHWVKNLDQVSISFSITFRSRESERRATVHQFNARLRARGFKPTPVGRLRALDNFKYQSARVVRRLERAVGRENSTNS